MFLDPNFSWLSMEAAAGTKQPFRAGCRKRDAESTYPAAPTWAIPWVSLLVKAMLDMTPTQLQEARPIRHSIKAASWVTSRRPPLAALICVVAAFFARVGILRASALERSQFVALCLN